MGHVDAAALLEQNLAEEKAADKKLSALAESGINQEAAEAADAGEQEDEEEETPQVKQQKSKNAARSVRG